MKKLILMIIVVVGVIMRRGGFYTLITVNKSAEVKRMRPPNIWILKIHSSFQGKLSRNTYV